MVVNDKSKACDIGNVHFYLSALARVFNVEHLDKLSRFVRNSILFQTFTYRSDEQTYIAIQISTELISIHKFVIIEVEN